MTADELLYDLRLAGFHLWLEGERLWVNPAPKLTDDQRANIRTYRDGLAELLREEAQAVPVLEHWILPDPMHSMTPPWENPPAEAVDLDLADWFRSALEAKQLPSRPFQLDRAQLVTEPARLYAWVGERLATPGASAIGAECAKIIRRLKAVVEGQP